VDENYFCAFTNKNCGVCDEKSAQNCGRSKNTIFAVVTYVVLNTLSAENAF